jgi:hypothetical protein
VNSQKYNQESKQLRELSKHPLNQAAQEQLDKLTPSYLSKTPIEDLIDLAIATELLNEELLGHIAGRVINPKFSRERLQIVERYLTPEEIQQAPTVEEAALMIADCLQLYLLER